MVTERLGDDDLDKHFKAMLEQERRIRDFVYYTKFDYCFGRCEDKKAQRGEKEGFNVVKCIDCNFGEILSYYCLEILYNGKRCKQEARASGYCRYHNNKKDVERIKSETKHEIRKIRDRFELTSSQLQDYYYYKWKKRKIPKKSFVYFLEQNGLVKIGHSINPEKRLRELQSEQNDTIIPDQVDIHAAKLLGVIRGGRAVENFLHVKFHERRIEGEWFTLDRSMKNKIYRILDEKDKEIETLIAQIQEIENVGE
jgi:hypothetical protein